MVSVDSQSRMAHIVDKQDLILYLLLRLLPFEIRRSSTCLVSNLLFGHPVINHGEWATSGQVFSLWLDFLLLENDYVVFLAVEDLLHVFLLSFVTSTLKEHRQLSINYQPVEAANDDTLE